MNNGWQVISKEMAKKYRNIFFNPNLVKIYFNISDEKHKEMFINQAKKYDKKPDNSPYWWAFVYWNNVDEDQIPKKTKKLLKNINSLFIREREI